MIQITIGLRSLLPVSFSLDAVQNLLGARRSRRRLIEEHIRARAFTAPRAGWASNQCRPLLRPDTTQSRRECFFISHDLGMHILTAAAFSNLARPHFGQIEVKVHQDMGRIPYLHAILECQN